MDVPPAEKPIQLSYRAPDVEVPVPPPLFGQGPDAGERVRSCFVRTCCLSIVTALVGAVVFVLAGEGILTVVTACFLMLPFALPAVSTLLAATLLAFAVGGVVREGCAPSVGPAAPLFAARVLGVTSPILSVLLAYLIAPRIVGRSMDWHEILLLVAIPPLVAGWVLARPTLTA